MSNGNQPPGLLTPEQAQQQWRDQYGSAIEGFIESFNEYKALNRELLEKAVGEIEPFKQSPIMGQQQSFLGMQQEMLGQMKSGVGQFFDPNSPLARSQAARLRTGARQQLSALGQNAALAGMPRARSSMLDVMQSATDRLASLPTENMLAGMQAAGGVAQLAGQGVGAASTALQTQMLPASMIAELYANTTVQDPLTPAMLAATQTIGQGMGNYFAPLPGYPYGYLQPGAIG